jgi:hypothetical protein
MINGLIEVMAGVECSHHNPCCKLDCKPRAWDLLPVTTGTSLPQPGTPFLKAHFYALEKRESVFLIILKT